MSWAVSTSLMPWPRAPNTPVSGSQKVTVPMPAMESRIHAPSLYCPSLLQRTARAVNWTVLSSRRRADTHVRVPRLLEGGLDLLYGVHLRAVDVG